jgi:hypothetical protein
VGVRFGTARGTRPCLCPPLPTVPSDGVGGGAPVERAPSVRRAPLMARVLSVLSFMPLAIPNVIIALAILLLCTSIPLHGALLIYRYCSTAGSGSSPTWCGVLR